MAYATKKKNSKCMAKGGEVKGVHKPHYEKEKAEKGRSVAGDYARAAGAIGSPPHVGGIAKAMHRDNIEALKSMPGPTSGKAGFAEGGEVDEMGEYDPMQHPMPKENSAANR